MSLNPHEIDRELVRLYDRLEERTDDYAEAVTRAAVADAAYRRLYAESMLQVIDDTAGRRTTVQEREARVDLACADAYSAKAITEATSKSVRASINSLQTQIDVARTIAASLRALTSPS